MRKKIRTRLESPTAVIPPSTCCFIRGVNIDDSGGPSQRGNHNDFENLKELVRRLCQLVSVEIRPEDWIFFEALREHQQSIFCWKCCDLLENVDRVQQLIKKAQNELKEYLNQVEILLLQSDSPNLQSSFWWHGCFDLRRNILNRFTPCLSFNNVLKDMTGVKTPWGKDEIVNDDIDGEPDDWDSLQLDQVFNQEELLNCTKDFMNSDTSQDTKLEELFATIELSFPNDTVETDPFPFVSPPVTPTTSPPKRKCRKRKNVEIFEEDPIFPEKVKKGRTRKSKASKKNAEETLKRSHVDNSGSDADESNDKYSDEYVSNHVNSPQSLTISEEEEDQADDSKGQIKSKEETVSEIGNADNNLNKGSKYGVGHKSGFEPFLLAAENLYLYRWDTFVRYTYTHLQCLAHNCNFKVEFEYYPSFQKMKDHLEDKHRSRKHRQKTPHSCIMCDTIFKNREAFTKHLKKVHGDQFGRAARTVCECCLTRTVKTHALFHLFTHKSQEEIDYAVETGGYYPPRILKKKESDMKETNFVCDHENCGVAFKNQRNLVRHKQTHLPKELRTDQVLCPECGKRILKEEFQIHLEKIHHPELVRNPLICEICEKRYHPGDKTNFDIHVRRHKGDKKEFLCPYCGLAFIHDQFLRAHIKQVHEDSEEPIPCDYCDHVYYKISTLKWHMRKKHPDEHSLMAETKNKSGFYPGHRRQVQVKGVVYGPIQQYPCARCDVICKYPYTLKKHMANIHGIGDVTVKRPLSLYRRGGVFEGREDSEGVTSTSTRKRGGIKNPKKFSVSDLVSFSKADSEES